MKGGILLVSNSTSDKESWLKSVLKDGQMREPKGVIRQVIILLGVGLAIFEIWLAAFGTMHPFQYASIFYPIVLSVSFLVYSSSKRVTGNQPTWVDIVLSLISLGISVFFLMHLEPYSERIPMFNPLTPMEIIVGAALILLTLEATRRTIGSTLAWIVLAFSVYVFFGDRLSGAYSHREITMNHYLDDVVYTINGLFGTPIGVAATYVFMFVLFGTFYMKAGGGDFFFKFASALSGRSVGGPAKVAVISSGMFGMISGSPTSDVLTTGSLSIPAMKRLGYKSIFAGGVEAAASTGGSILPPIMGTAAFLMAEYAGIPYGQIVIAALFPAILYYLGVFLQVHFRAKRENMAPLENTPRILLVLKEGWVFILPLVFLIWGIMEGYTASYVVVMTSALIIVMSWFLPGRRIGIRKIILTFEETIIKMIPVTMACAAAGILIGEIMLTGLASKLGSLIFQFTLGNIFLTLLATAVLCIIFGMGMPVSSAYILTAVLAAPVLIQLGMPVLSSHLFIVYFSCLSAITPPVAVAAFAASSIAQADPIRIGLNACKLAFIGFILPFMFVFQPGLLMQGNIMDIIWAVPTATIGVVAMSASVEGWLTRRLLAWQRFLLMGGGLCMLYPGLVTDALGIAAIILGFFPVLLKRNSESISSQS